jgi:hypothetical protein
MRGPVWEFERGRPSPSAPSRSPRASGGVARARLALSALLARAIHGDDDRLPGAANLPDNLGKAGFYRRKVHRPIPLGHGDQYGHIRLQSPRAHLDRRRASGVTRVEKSHERLPNGVGVALTRAARRGLLSTLGARRGADGARRAAGGDRSIAPRPPDKPDSRPRTGGWPGTTARARGPAKCPRTPECGRDAGPPGLARRLLDCPSGDAPALDPDHLERTPRRPP